MAATLYLHEEAKALIVNALEEDLTHAFLAKETANIELFQGQHTSITSKSSDGSDRIKHLRFDTSYGSRYGYTTTNSLSVNDESRITNFYIREGIPVNKLVLMNSTGVANGIITFPTITPPETKSLYVPEIKINVL